MNIHQLLENLHQKRRSIDLAIHEIESQLANERIKTKRISILQTIKREKRQNKPKASNKKGYVYDPGTHWMQKPENKARVAALARKMHKARKHEAK
jgi:hypothetical protein